MKSRFSVTQWLRELRSGRRAARSAHQSAAGQTGAHRAEHRPSLIRSSLARSSLVRASLLPAGTPEADCPTLLALREQMVAQIEDCVVPDRKRIVLAVLRSSNALDLWLLRIELFQCISQSHGQLEARKRINALIPLFAKKMPKSQLAAI